MNRIVSILDSLAHDWRYGIRTLRKHPGFALSARVRRI